MLLDINKIQGKQVTFDRKLEVRRVGDEPEGVGDSVEVRFQGVAHRGERGVLLTGQLTAKLTLACSRCLDGAEFPIDEAVSLTLVGEAVEFAPPETRLEAEDCSLYYAEGGVADLTAIAREQVLLHRPWKPMCNRDCKGLCATCGANRNRIECDCRGGDLDPRLAPLLALKQRMGDS